MTHPSVVIFLILLVTFTYSADDAKLFSISDNCVKL